MGIKINIKTDKNNNQAFKIPSNMLNGFQSRVKIGFRKMCQNTKRHAYIETSEYGKHTGRTYYINGKKHIASASGESHASITGKLTNSIIYNVQSSRVASFGYDKSTKYGRYLELGTNKMKARPTLKNAMKNAKIENENILTNVLSLNSFGLK